MCCVSIFGRLKGISKTFFDVMVHIKHVVECGLLWTTSSDAVAESSGNAVGKKGKDNTPLRRNRSNSGLETSDDPTQPRKSTLHAVCKHIVLDLGQCNQIHNGLNQNGKAGSSEKSESDTKSFQYFLENMTVNAPNGLLSLMHFNDGFRFQIESFQKQLVPDSAAIGAGTGASMGASDNSSVAAVSNSTVLWRRHRVVVLGQGGHFESLIRACRPRLVHAPSSGGVAASKDGTHASFQKPAPLVAASLRFSVDGLTSMIFQSHKKTNAVKAGGFPTMAGHPKPLDVLVKTAHMPEVIVLSPALQSSLSTTQLSVDVKLSAYRSAMGLIQQLRLHGIRASDDTHQLQGGRGLHVNATTTTNSSTPGSVPGSLPAILAHCYRSGIKFVVILPLNFTYSRHVRSKNQSSTGSGSKKSDEDSIVKVCCLL